MDLSHAFDKALSAPGMQVKLAIPDLWQQEAIRSLKAGQDVVVSAPTAAGKTFVFEQLIREGKFPGPGEQAVYTVPTRALANDKWREWNALGWDVGIATGDVAEKLDAPVLVATLETQRERLLRGEGPRMIVIDEYQMIGDERRGLNYELAIALAPPETQLLFLSGSVANPEAIVSWLKRLGRDAVTVKTDHRPVPLEDLHVMGLPNRAPEKTKNFWQRLAQGVLLSDMGPLLIFAPQRRVAEKIARKIADSLPDDDPIEFGDQALSQLCGTDLAKLLRKRVAWHHSGLSYAQRAAIVEPLAKAGQLRVIVATMGLAAGINFSMRSVHIADTHYSDGPFLKTVAPDELLQMFGRAGRRGLDEMGFVISSNQSPRLSDARSAQLRRSNELDWPPLLRVMATAAEKGESPFLAAAALRDRLFSEQSVRLGFQRSHLREEKAGVISGTESDLFGLGPTQQELKNLAGEWETWKKAAPLEVPAGDAVLGETGKPLVETAAFVQVNFLAPKTRICRLDDGEGARRYGFEMAVATKLADDLFRLTKALRAKTGLEKADADLTLTEIETLLPEYLEPDFGGAAIHDFMPRGDSLVVRADPASIPVLAVLDASGAAIHQPVFRSVKIEAETHYTDVATGNAIDPAPGSPAQAWRTLGLIDAQGVPTERGTIFSFFQNGEGLAIAAALEDATYPIDELLIHLANLRASLRYDGAESIGSERLAATCRSAYGPVDYEGYLRLGIPPTWGEGAAEAIEAWLTGGNRAISQFGFGAGDIERAWIEWHSLLRHLKAAPALPENERWEQLRAAASSEIERRPRENPLRDLPELSSTLLTRRPQHRLSYRSL